MELSTIRRVLLVSPGCYLDDSNGAAVASRALMETLAQRGFDTEVLCGSMLDSDQEVDPVLWLSERGWRLDRPYVQSLDAGPSGVRNHDPRQLRLTVRGVPITLYHRSTTRLREQDGAETREFLCLLEQVLIHFRPQVVVAYGGGPMIVRAMAMTQASGAATVFPLHNFHYHDPSTFAGVDAVLVASKFAAEYYREALGLECTVLPYLIDLDRVRAQRHEPKFVTFVNPSFEKGVHAFARIADELGRRRPDIPLLVVEGRGTEATVAACGMELRVYGNTFFMAHTPDPRRFWGLSRICLMPSLWWENQPLTAIEAMINGIPVIGSDRGGIPETLGDAGMKLPLPDRLTPATRILPTAEEVAPWVESIIRLWDDAEYYAHHRARALREVRRWATDVLGPRYERLFSEIRPGWRHPVAIPKGRSKCVVIVPHVLGISEACEHGLQGLEAAGVPALRHRYHSQLEVALDQVASRALQEGFEKLLFVGPEIGFHPLDALRLLARPEPVLAGVYSQGSGRLSCRFVDRITDVVFGPYAFGLYPLTSTACGFLRVRAETLRRMIRVLELPWCDRQGGRGFWPFFQSTIRSALAVDDQHQSEGGAFSARLALIGATAMADTTIELQRQGLDHPSQGVPCS
jgi:glycosyltransferase involved in cell wall biosynthesis